MKLAVATWEGRISPVFDSARRLSCYEVTDGTARPVGEAALPSDQPLARVEKLRELGVAVLLCGAVSRPLAAMITAAGIRLTPFLTGEVDQVVVAFACGRIADACYQMPGCCGRRHRRRHGQCGGRWEVKS